MSRIRSVSASCLARLSCSRATHKPAEHSARQRERGRGGHHVRCRHAWLAGRMGIATPGAPDPSAGGASRR
eukprot:641061-Prymnesium_polylepis.2